MNEHFLCKLDESGMTMRQLSIKSGVSYAVINDIKNQKKDINKRDADIVVRLASALDAKPGDLLNPIHIMDKTRGKYRNVEYLWEYRDGLCLFFYDGDKEISEQTDLDDSTGKKRVVFDKIAEIIIDRYFRKKQVNGEIDAIIASMRGGAGRV